MSSDNTFIPGLRAAARPAWTALADTLQTLAGLGLSTPCERDPAFTSDDPAPRFDAAKLCQLCPAREPCRTFAEANRETTSVWGGHDRTFGSAGYRRDREAATAPCRSCEADRDVCTSQQMLGGRTCCRRCTHPSPATSPTTSPEEER